MSGQAKVYVTTDGADVRIGSHGNASRLSVKDAKGHVTFVDLPAIVPAEVAAEFEGLEGFKVERDEPAKKAPPKARE